MKAIHVDRFVLATREARRAFARAVRCVAEGFGRISDAATLGRLNYAVRLLGRRPRHLPRRINGRLRPLRRKG